MGEILYLLGGVLVFLLLRAVNSWWSPWGRRLPRLCWPPPPPRLPPAAPSLVLWYGRSICLQVLTQTPSQLFWFAGGLSIPSFRDPWTEGQVSFLKASHAFGLPRWLSDQESACQCRRGERRQFDPWIGKNPWSRKWQATLLFPPRESHGQRSLASCSP